MKMQTPEGSELIEVTGVEAAGRGLVISGTIMGAMPMKAVLTPGQLRAGFRFLGPRVMVRLLAMLVRRD